MPCFCKMSVMPVQKKLAGITWMLPPMKMPLEKALSYIQGDELVEVTPESIRLRKRWLDPNERKKRMREKAVA